MPGIAISLLYRMLANSISRNITSRLYLQKVFPSNIEYTIFLGVLFVSTVGACRNLIAFVRLYIFCESVLAEQECLDARFYTLGRTSNDCLGKAYKCVSGRCYCCITA